VNPDLAACTDAVLGKTGRRDRVDTATRMAIDADFIDRGVSRTREPEPAQNVDQIDEPMRIVGVQGKELPPRRP
jgi:hypothetical protein